MLVSAAAFLVDAVLFDALISLVPRATFFNQGVLVEIGETLELLGAIGVLYAVLDYIIE